MLAHVGALLRLSWSHPEFSRAEFRMSWLLVIILLLSQQFAIDIRIRIILLPLAVMYGSLVASKAGAISSFSRIGLTVSYYEGSEGWSNPLHPRHAISPPNGPRVKFHSVPIGLISSYKLDPPPVGEPLSLHWNETLAHYSSHLLPPNLFGPASFAYSDRGEDDDSTFLGLTIQKLCVPMDEMCDFYDVMILEATSPPAWPDPCGNGTVPNTMLENIMANASTTPETVLKHRVSVKNLRTMISARHRYVQGRGTAGERSERRKELAAAARQRPPSFVRAGVAVERPTTSFCCARFARAARRRPPSFVLASLAPPPGHILLNPTQVLPKIRAE
jgi:hypothetical protein